jgi:hypothetical protein
MAVFTDHGEGYPGLNWFHRFGRVGLTGASWDRAITGTIIVRVLLGGFGLVILDRKSVV